ncbi:MAG: tyrosine-type recombinase/integrase [Solirubrobacteraceae bacterium]
MSVRWDRGGWEVRWRDEVGRRRAKRFADEQAARSFDDALHDVDRAERRPGKAAYGSRGGVYEYQTREGTRWRYVARRSDGKQTSKRGFTSPSAARAAFRRVVEQVERGEVRHSTYTFATWWAEWLRGRKPHVEPGTWSNYEVEGRKRLLPAFGEVPLHRLSGEIVRAWMEEQAEAVDAGEYSPKTINNTLGTLVVCLNAAVKQRVVASNPALEVERLAPVHIEREYLRLREIPLYIDSCSEVYRPLAEVLIGAGLRISEALALKVRDLELEDEGGVIVVYRSRKGDADGATKSRRFRPVEIGPSLARSLTQHVARRGEMSGADPGGAYLFVMPTRTSKVEQGRWHGKGDGERMDRNTVSRDWHKAALRDAALRDMPLHALRHTAAAAWLAGGNSLMYVQRQLGHADIATTERYYGHLERRVLAAGARATEQAIARAASVVGAS